MKNSLKYALNQASETEIFEHLNQCGRDFHPPLHERVNLLEYSRKIKNQATSFEAWSETLVGLVAAYCTDMTGTAFVTNVSVAKACQGRGIGLQLMNNCIQHVKALGFVVIDLEVHQDSQNAIRLYERLGFQTANTKGSSSVMRLNIRKHS